MPDIWCIVVGETTPFSVTIDETRSVDALKGRIKKKKEPMLDAFAADQLTLYKINEVKFERSSKHLEAVQEISQNLSKQTSLDPWIQLSTIEDGFPPGTLHILVQPPASESIDPRVWCVTEASPISSRHRSHDDACFANSIYSEDERGDRSRSRHRSDQFAKHTRNIFQG